MDRIEYLTLKIAENHDNWTGDYFKACLESELKKGSN